SVPPVISLRAAGARTRRFVTTARPTIESRRRRGPSGATASARWAVPPTDLRRQRRGLGRPPATGLVLVHGYSGAENGLDDGPCRFDGVLAREERRIARHRIAEQALVSLHLLCVRLVNHVQLRRVGEHLLSGPLHARADRDLHL